MCQDSRLGYCAIKTMHLSVVSSVGQTQLGHGSESHDTMKHYVDIFQHSYMTLKSKQIGIVPQQGRI